MPFPPLQLTQTRQSRRGIALISVLAMVMLLTALTVAFMMRAGSEKQSSGFYRAEATTRELSDTTLNLVEGEINEATTQGITFAWASQPGAIRVYDNTGNPAKTFKLYSAASMVAPTTSTAAVQTFLSADVQTSSSGTKWYQAPGMWVDLNAPVNSDPNPSAATGLGNPIYTHFPILDPRLPTSTNLATLLSDTNPTTKLPYMDGFAITNPPKDLASVDSNGTPNPAPMPVQWLYVLQDGTMTAPSSGPDASGNYTFPSIPTSAMPTAANPIVGRIAFWTDDETCKVNVNTAGADGIMGETQSKDRPDPAPIANGTFWSPPYFASPDDTGVNQSTQVSGPYSPGFAIAQPVAGEYQRYPGHPATVALSNILNTLKPTSSINTTSFYAASTTVPGVTPRYVYGGTQENTLDTFGNGAYATANNLTLSNTLTASFRLFPSLSETLFHPDRTSTTSLNSASASDTYSRQRMEAGRFFLTAHSRAPELNLFGLPRVSIWPMSSNVSWRTPTDNLIAFCTTIGGTQGNTIDSSAYYFTRSSCGDSTVDVGLMDSSLTHRNALILNYLDYVTRQNIPGFGGNFYTKDYGGGNGGLTGQNDQILTEIFDYVRSTNIQDGTSPSPYNGQAASYAGWNYSSSNGGWWGVGQVVPSLINSSDTGGLLSWNTQGNASYPRLVEATLQFVAMGRVGTTLTGTGAPGTSVLTTSAVVNPSIMSYASSTLPSLLGTGDSSNTLTYPYNAPPGTPTLDLPYAAPGTSGGAPSSGPYNTIYPVLNTKTGYTSGVPPDGTTAVQAYVILTFVNPAQDWVYCSPCVWVSISGLKNLAIKGYNLGFPDPDCMLFASGQDWHGGGRSGYYPLDCNFQGKWTYFRVPGHVNTNLYSGNPFFSSIIPITSDNTAASKMAFSGGIITISLFDAIGGYTAGIPLASNSTAAPIGGHQVSTYQIDFPAGDIPVPILPPNSSRTPVATPPKTAAQNYYDTTVNPIVDNRDTEFPPNSILPLPYTGPPTPVPSYAMPTHGTGNPYEPFITPNIAYGTATTAWSGMQVSCFEQSGPLIGLPQPNQNANLPALASIPGDTNITIYNRWNQYGALLLRPDENLIGTGDTVESMVLSKKWSDPRLLAISSVPMEAFVQHPSWGQQFAHNMYWGMVLPLPGNGNSYWAGGTSAGGTSVLSPWACLSPSLGTLAGNVVDPQPASWPTFAWAPSIFGDNMAPTTNSGAPPDWDSGLTTGSDGPWTNKADEGSAGYGAAMPYYGNPVGQPPQLFTANRQVCSPGMLGSLPTGVDPTGKKPAGWQTLLFRPGPGAANAMMAAAGMVQTAGNPHPGEGVPAGTGLYGPPYTTPPDHLWMDLFWIPITEPYAISEPMSTAGKINLNYQIVPFTYIKRATALRAAMATEKVTQVGLWQSPTCKGNGYPEGLALNGAYTGAGSSVNARYPIDLDVTLSQFDRKFDLTNSTTGCDLFHSASQLCEAFLVPMDIPNTLPSATATAGTTLNSWGTVKNATPTGNYPLPSPANSGDITGVGDFANDWYVPVKTPQDPAKYTNAPFAMVGDNLREQPYAHLYAKVTTKSNTFTVYYRAQSLKKPVSVAAGVWNENLGTITGEYRGSTTIERFIDPNEKTSAGNNVVPDAAAQIASNTAPTSLEAYYKWRVVENHQFAP